MAEVFDLESLEVNIPSTDFGNYCIFLAGAPKWGKTTFCTKLDKPLIFDFEEGAKGLVTYRVPISSWSQVKKYVRQLEKNPELNKKYKTICFDTINYAISYLQKYVIDYYQEKHPDKVVDSLNKIGYGIGYQMIDDELREVITKLKKAGYGVVIVSHVKDKVLEKESEAAHIKTVPDLTDRWRNLLTGEADFLLLGDIDTIVEEPAVLDDDGKVIKPAKTRTERVIYLRESDSVQAGMRWEHAEDMPLKIPYDIEILKDVFLKAVSAEIERGKKKFSLSDDVVKEITEKLNQQRVKEREEFFQKQKEQEQLKEMIEQIKKTAKELAANGVSVKEKINPILGGNPDKITSLETAQEILSKLQALEN